MPEINYAVGTVEEQDAAASAIRQLLLWRTVTKVSDDTLLLDNGVRLQLRGNDGCGGCQRGNYDLTELAGCPNAITAVEFETDYGADVEDPYVDSVYRVFVLAENRRIKLAEFQGGSDNGYYGDGFWVAVKGPDHV